tara:strand:- start:13049 stop:13222 length:174 start_codon:yes stop_codon:yes gene_type:complete
VVFNLGIKVIKYFLYITIIKIKVMKEVFIKIKYKLKKLSPTGREMFIEDLLDFIKNY